MIEYVQATLTECNLIYLGGLFSTPAGAPANCSRLDWNQGAQFGSVVGAKY